ncbi:archaeosortase/exosortase family protein [Chlorobium sp. N1]|uniref:archaeosortase/exosortase family protein n=1 Tax=Chlorobium sp. N1 TaxID=2491138 RepID=UPI00103D2EC0|nr:archaeosortase/exosortase family protein [Chlorobium sp. N1]TCD48563.1 exosortase/archaeosortase family protein [Chlorobium sp. N1]
MSKRDIPVIMLLALMAAFIWLRDLSWTDQPADSLPILLSLPLFVWLGAPWKLQPGPLRLSSKGLILIMTSLVTGVATGWSLMLAVGWTALLWIWLSARLAPEGRQRVRKLLILPLMAFPWLLLDAHAVGWWFRLSGSWAAGEFFSLIGFNAVHEGTRVLVEGLPIDVSPACSGINALQSMLIAGSSLAYIILGHHPAYWLNLPLLIVISWIANTLRIITITFAALVVSPEFASGVFHGWGGWSVLLLMFGLSWVLFTLQRNTLIEKSARQ